MDVLRPQLVTFDGRNYRKNPIQEKQYQHEEDEDFYPDSMEYSDEPCGAYEVAQTPHGFRATVSAPSLLYKHIVGKRGDTKKKIEVETKTSINIPKPGHEGEIVITGQHRNGVVSARTRIDVLLDTFRRRQPFTHFLSFFLNEVEVQERFLKFQEEVLKKCSKDRGVDSTIFQNPKKLHLTIGMLVLLSEQEIQQTCEILQRCKEEFINDISGGKPLEVEMAGIEYMNDDPAMVDVLYAKVHMKDGSNRLQELVDRVLERFQSLGLIVKEWTSVKLHATVMNTLLRKDPNAEGRYNLYTADGKYIFKERESFDGRNILKEQRRTVTDCGPSGARQLGGSRPFGLPLTVRGGCSSLCSSLLGLILPFIPSFCSSFLTPHPPFCESAP
ncbi:activating signal cointegrator 1 complex subunit 1 isoform X3 [Mastomys coucha]|nr:activating signal cointegrator 1 complex subunit 1 isoform X3 [Mastomys coucha]XP_031204435.1 activating signal cointegrator 1 complex subunit 1 isoform X3 [Mastomys coucha]XP_031204436.1 activating signal cointegrator 1 complex subunit 1 isoform X3 [Mastomys coucha]